MSKRILGIALILIMVLSIAPMTAFSQSSDTVDGSAEKRAEWLTYLEENQIDPLNQIEGISVQTNNIVSMVPSPAVLGINEQIAPMASSFQAFSATAASTTNVKRYTVLVLDRSGSMYGTPMTVMKQSAIKFCDAVLKADGENYVAVVAYDTYADIICEFTSNYATLQTAINDIYDWNLTNTNDGLLQADTLLSTIPNETGVIKNILLLSDGLPNEGDYTYSGRYIYDDYHYYEYANVVYNTATALKEKGYFIYTLGFFHDLRTEYLPFARRFMNDLQNAGYYDVIDPNDLEFVFGEIADDIVNPTGTFKYAGFINQTRDSSTRYNYDDAYFLKDARTYNPQLATMSLCFELSSWSSYDANEWPHKSKNARELLTGEVLQSNGTYDKKNNGIGFKDFDQNSVWNQAPTKNSIGLVAANKTITDVNNGDKEYTLIAVAVRGGGYYSEWGGNFNVGSTGFHAGFDLAKTQTLTFISNYITTHNISGDIKLWIVGFSRAGATANLAAGAINAGYSLPNVSLAQKDLFCYTFEAPQGVLESQATQTTHTNIHNVVNLNDPVPMVAFSAWDFQRYNASNDYILPSLATANFNGTNGKLDNMLKQFEVLGYSRNLYSIIETTRTLEVNVNWSKILPGGDPFITVDVINDRGMTNNQMLQGLMTSFATTAMVNRSNYVSTFQTELVEFMATTNAPGKKELVREFLTEILEGLERDDNKEFKHIIAPVKSINPFYSTSSRLNDVKIRLLNHVSASAEKKGLTLTPDFLNSLVDSLVALINFDDGILLLKAADNVALKADIFQPHWPEISLAWLMSQDTSYTSGAVHGSSPRTARIIYINCPVDVSVYDGSNNLMTSIIGDQPSDGHVYSAINENGEKVLFLPSDEDYTFDITATSNCSVTCTISEYDMLTGTVNRLINYYSLPIESGNTFHGVVPSFDQSELENGTPNGSAVAYRLLDGSGSEIPISEEFAGEIVDNNYFTVSVGADDGNGFVSGGGEFLKGTFAQVKAQPLLGSSLLGWYVDDDLVSSDEIYRFAVKEDVKLVAKFASVNTHEVIITATSGGTATGAAGLYVPGTELEMVAEAITNYRFKNWTTSNGGTFTDVNNTNTTFTMPANATTVTANFEYIGGNYSGGGGSYTSATPSHSFSGGNNKYIKDMETPLILTIQKDLSLFRDIRKSGNILMRDTQYKAESGSTIITLSTDYLNTLSAGQHTLEVRFTDGATVNANFTVEESEKETPTPTPEPWVNPFTDVRESDWFYEAVKYANQKGLVAGTSATTFSPQVTMTRGMMVTILWNYTGKPQTGNAVFTDVADGAWYAGAVNWAAANGIVSGYGNGLFGPNDEITRQQMAVILHNYTKFINLELPKKRIGAFVDDAQISTWAKKAVDAMYAAEILNGKGNNDFDPQGRATRAQVVAMMRNFLETIAD